MKKLVILVSFMFLAGLCYAASPADPAIDEAKKMMDAGKFEEALAKLTEAEKADDKNKDVFRYQGFCLRSVKKFEDSIKAYDKCLALDPKFDKAFFNQGECYVALKQYDKALVAFEKVIELGNKETLPMAYAGKVNALKEQGKTEDAAKTLADLIKMDPKIGHATAADFYYKQADYPKAIESYLKVLEADPKNAGICYNCACSYSLAKDAAKAVEMLDKALTLDQELLKEKNENNKLRQQVEADKDFDNVKESPEFKKLLEKFPK